MGMDAYPPLTAGLKLLQFQLNQIMRLKLQGETKKNKSFGINPMDHIKKAKTIYGKSYSIKICIIIGVLVLGACQQARPFTAFTHDFYWESDQSQISATDGTLNIWSGFSIENSAFHSNQGESLLTLWRRTPINNALLKIDYQLEGSPAVFFSPGKKSLRLTLPSSPKFRRIDCRINLKTGLNLLSFFTEPGSRLVVRGVAVGEPMVRRHLEKGESLILYPTPGKGELTLAGKGRIRIETILFTQTGEKKTQREDSTGLFSSTLRVPFSFPERGCLKITAVSGRFNISGYFNQAKPVAAVQSPRFKGKPDIFIFLLDACQASHLGIYGYHRPISPNIDRLAREAVVFENAYTNVVYTQASTSSFFTGRLPDNSNNSFLQAKTTLFQFLQGQGYTVGLQSESFFISERSNFPRAGVHSLDYYPDWREPAAKKRIIQRFCELLKNPSPRFIYLHYLEPHLPIVPPPPFRDMFNTSGKVKKGERLTFSIYQNPKLAHSPMTPDQVQEVVDDYDSSIAYIDGEVGKLFNCLKTRGLYNDSLIIIMADHGEALYEHQEWFHGGNVYEETTRVPLIVKFPQQMGLKGRVARVVQLLDLFPTLVDACGLRLPLEGRSLLQAVAAPGLDDTLVIARTIIGPLTYGVRWQNWYYMYNMKNSREKLFQMKSGNPDSIADKHPELCRMLYLRLLDRINQSQTEATIKKIDTSKLSKKEIENLKTLGYL